MAGLRTNALVSGDGWGSIRRAISAARWECLESNLRSQTLVCPRWRAWRFRAQPCRYSFVAESLRRPRTLRANRLADRPDQVWESNFVSVGFSRVDVDSR